MTERIPNLWRLKEDARRLYQLLLAHLIGNGLHERVISVCRQIRRYAARGPGCSEGLFTFSFEIDSLCELENYKVAWRQLHRRERLVFGNRFYLADRQWSPDDFDELVWFSAPLLFFLGRYRPGCSLLETALSFCFQKRAVRSYDILFHVYNDDEVPAHRCSVTLKHFYDRLGQDLRKWRYWEAFVNGFHPRLFRLTGIQREELLGNSAQLAVFFDRLMNVRAERTISGVGGGQSDLVDSEAKVKKRQQILQEKLAQFRERIRPKQKRTNAKLRELFPELRSLLR